MFLTTTLLEAGNFMWMINSQRHLVGRVSEVSARKKSDVKVTVMAEESVCHNRLTVDVDRLKTAKSKDLGVHS